MVGVEEMETVGRFAFHLLLLPSLPIILHQFLSAHLEHLRAVPGPPLLVRSWNIQGIVSSLNQHRGEIQQQAKKETMNHLIHERAI